MGAALRRLFLSLGVALGIAQGQPDPVLVAHAWAEDGALLASARVENAFAPGSVELVESGTRVALRFEASYEGSDGRKAEVLETRAIWYDLRSGRYGVSFEGGKTAALVDPEAARTLASDVAGMELVPASAAAGRGAGGGFAGGRVVVRAEIGIVNARGEWHGAPVLWNYASPSAALALVDGRSKAPR